MTAPLPRRRWHSPSSTRPSPVASPHRLRVEEVLIGHTRARTAYVSDAAGHLMRSGGKRFRPLLVLLAAEAGAHPDADEVLTAACVVELTHVASLYHDDVMDEASCAAAPTPANARWDNHVAILTGDFLFVEVLRAHRRARPRGGADPGAHLHPARRGPDPGDRRARPRRGPARALPRGRRRQDRLPDRHVRPLRRHVRRCAAEVVAALTSYGEIVGSAFQLSDDILDIASESAESGKTPGTDLREGVPTLPVLMAQASTDPADARLLELLDADLTDDDLHAEALDLLRKHPAMEQARGYVLAESERAKALLTALEPGSVRTALESFADIVADRTS